MRAAIHRATANGDPSRVDREDSAFFKNAPIVPNAGSAWKQESVRRPPARTLKKYPGDRSDSPPSHASSGRPISISVVASMEWMNAIAPLTEARELRLRAFQKNQDDDEASPERVIAKMTLRLVLPSGAGRSAADTNSAPIFRSAFCDRTLLSPTTKTTRSTNRKA